MYAIIKDVNGNEQQRYDVPDVGALDCGLYADLYADECGLELEFDKHGASIPDGCEDFSVTLTADPHSVNCWLSENYLFARD